MTKITKIPEITEKILKDQILTQKLCDRIYQLMQEDIRIQRETYNSNYRRIL